MMLLPIVPEEEPLASLLDILLAAACQDVAHLCFHLTQVHLRHFITSGFGDGRGIFRDIWIVLPFHLHSCFATLSQPLDELIITWEGKTCKSRTFSVFFQRTAMSMGATMAARVEAIGHTLPQVQAFLCPTALLALFGKCINKTHPGLSLLVLWVSRLVWIVGYWGRDTLTEHINYSSGLPGPSEEKRKGKQHCNMNGYEGGRYLYYRKYSVQSACPCLLLPEVGSSRSGLKDPK